jgi:glutamate racemase
VTSTVIKRYLSPLIKNRIDTLILGCTHYPLLKYSILNELNKKVRIIDSGPSAARMLHKALVKNELLTKRKTPGILQIFVTDLSPHFTRIGERFLKQPLHNVRIVSV